ncbi:MAG: hypothetical protein ACYS76_03660 [Planctomycetota bacterium]
MLVPKDPSADIAGGGSVDIDDLRTVASACRRNNSVNSMVD